MAQSVVGLRVRRDSLYFCLLDREPSGSRALEIDALTKNVCQDNFANISDNVLPRGQNAVGGHPGILGVGLRGDHELSHCGSFRPYITLKLISYTSVSLIC